MYIWRDLAFPKIPRPNSKLQMSKKFENSNMSPLLQAQELFINEWGRMSSSWGINRTFAQILALLFITGEAMTVEQIMERLQISRGNASMNLRDLQDWGIVRKFRRPGERRDTYLAEGDPWQMFVRVVRERKRREIDPTVQAIQECIDKLPEDDRSEESVVCRSRLSELLEIFRLIDLVYSQAVATDRVYMSTVESIRNEGRFSTGIDR